MDGKNNEVILLLRDYMNFLPSGPQEAFVPLGSGFGTESGFPLTAESLRRLNKNSLTGETYDKLDKALLKLDAEEPNLYEAIMVIYLREEAGHRDVDHIRSVARAGSSDAQKLLDKHDKAIEKLESYLANDDLYVRFPHKATGPKPGQNMDEMHEQLYSIFLRYFEEDGLPYRQALANAVFKMDDYYSPRHADRIVKRRLKDLDEEAS
jgi:hypothetical protein